MSPRGSFDLNSSPPSEYLRDGRHRTRFTGEDTEVRGWPVLPRGAQAEEGGAERPPQALSLLPLHSRPPLCRPGPLEGATSSRTLAGLPQPPVPPPLPTSVLKQAATHLAAPEAGPLTAFDLKAPGNCWARYTGLRGPLRQQHLLPITGGGPWLPAAGRGSPWL